MNEFRNYCWQIEELFKVKPKIFGLIDKTRYIYDKELPHISFEINELQVGDYLHALVVENRLDSNNFPRLVLSLQNSKLQHSSQAILKDTQHELEFEREQRVFYKLGITRTKEDKECPLYKNMNSRIGLNSLSTLINEIGINQYATLQYKDDLIIPDPDYNEFNFQKIRDLQNINWSEDCVLQGLRYEEENQDVPGS